MTKFYALVRRSQWHACMPNFNLYSSIICTEFIHGSPQWTFPLDTSSNYFWKRTASPRANTKMSRCQAGGSSQATIMKEIFQIIFAERKFVTRPSNGWLLRYTMVLTRSNRHPREMYGKNPQIQFWVKENSSKPIQDSLRDTGLLNLSLSPTQI